MADLLDEGVLLIPFKEDEESQCFAFLLKAPGGIDETIKATTAEESIDGPLVRSEVDLPEGPLFRFQAYKEAWEECLERIKIISLKLQKPVVEQAVRCIYESALQQEDDFLLPVQEMMTVVVSGPDRSFVHTTVHYICKILTISDHDTDDKLPLTIVSRIHETDCTTLASMVKGLVSGFKSHSLDTKLTLKSSSDIQSLLPWMEEIKVQYGSDVLLIILFPDLSLIESNLLADFLDLCHCYISELPLTILGTSSDPAYLHDTLPRSTLVKLRLENFSLPCDRQVFEHLIEETFFSLEYAPRLMIGLSGLQMIISEYSRSNATLDGLLSNIQHFYNPLSLLCVPSFDVSLRAMLQDSEDNPSWIPFMKLLRLKLLSKDMTGSDWSDLSPSKVLERAIEGRRSFRTRMSHMKVALRVWRIILNFCRARGIKLKESSLLETGLETMRAQVDIGDTIADTIVSSLKLLDKVQTEALLEELFYFVDSLPPTVRNLTTGLKSHIVVAMNSSEKPELFSDFLARYFRATLTSFDDIPLLDIWRTSDDALPNSPFNPNVHVSIVTSLLEPRGYLGWGASYHMTDARSLPDVSLAFQRYVDSGKMINLYDWYQTFVTAFEGYDGENDSMDVEDTPTKPRHNKPSRLMQRKKASQSTADADAVDKRELQARFMRTVHELEFVGFLKRTGRRTEHVIKTVFDIMA